MPDLVSRVIRKLRERRFTRAVRAVLATPPVVPRDDGVILFSMIGTRVLLPYLVAIKSLHAQLGRGRIVILDDGSLTAADRAILAAQLGGPEIRPIQGVDTGPCPRGGTWERLLTILDLRREAYVIQLDSDTVTTAPLPDVSAAIAAGRSFTLAGGGDAALLPLAEIAARANAHPAPARLHVQEALERAIDRVVIPGRTGLRYVRGCSGFAGFAPDPSGRALAEAFSAAAQGLLGSSRWAEWGTEQVTSSFVVANEPDPLVLCHDRYRNYWGEPNVDGAAFVHFVGTFRFARGLYRRTALAAIAALRG